MDNSVTAEMSIFYSTVFLLRNAVLPVQLRSRILRAALNSSSADGFVHKENDRAGAFLLLHGRYSVLPHYLKVSLKNSCFLKIPKLHPQIAAVFICNSSRSVGIQIIVRPDGLA